MVQGWQLVDLSLLNGKNCPVACSTRTIYVFFENVVNRCQMRVRVIMQRRSGTWEVSPTGSTSNTGQAGRRSPRERGSWREALIKAGRPGGSELVGGQKLVCSVSSMQTLNINRELAKHFFSDVAAATAFSSGGWNTVQKDPSIAIWETPFNYNRSCCGSPKVFLKKFALYIITLMIRESWQACAPQPCHRYILDISNICK